MNAEKRKLRRRALADCTNTIASRSSLSSSSLSKAPPSLINPSKPSLPANKPRHDVFNSDASVGFNDDQNPTITGPHPSTPLRPPKSSSASACNQRQTAENIKNKGKAVDVPFESINVEDPPTPHRRPESSNNLACNQNQNAENIKNKGKTVDVPFESINAEDPSTPHPRAKSSYNSGTGDCEVFRSFTVYSRKQPARKRKNMGKAIALPMSGPPVERISGIGDKFNEAGDIGLSKSCTVPRPKHKKKLCRLLPEQGVSKHALTQDFIEQQRAYFAEIDAFELPEEVVSDSELE